MTCAACIFSTTVVGLILALLLVVAFVFTIGIALRHELPLWRRE